MPPKSYIPPRFRFYLKLSDTYYYYVAAGGSVGITTIAGSGVQEPIGWKETEIKWARSLTYWGLITTLTTAYKFVEDGAKILRNVYCTQGIEGKCKLVIEKRRKTDFTYEAFYEGEVDFSTFLDEDTQVTVNIEQGGLNALFRSNTDTPYEVVAFQEAIRMDGVALRNKSIMQVSGSSDVTTYMPSLTNIFNESDLAPSTRNQVERSLEYDLLIKGYPFFVAQQDTEVTVEFDINLRLEYGSGSPGVSNLYRLVMGRYNPATMTVTPVTVFAASVITLLNTTTVTTVTLTASLVQGETLSFLGALCDTNGDFIIGQGGGNTQYDLQQIFYGTIIKVSYYTKLPESTAGASRYHDVVTNLMALLSGGTAVMNMPFLTSPATVSVYNRPYHTWLVTAQELRGIPLSKYKLKFSDLFKDMNGRWLLGIGIVGNTATIAPLSDFFQDVQIADLGEVTDFQVVPATDILFSDLKIGMKTNSADSLNGRFEVTSDQTWKAPLVRTDKARDASSNFISGMYSIEQIKNQIGKDTTNTEPDNDIVVLETEAAQVSGRYPLYRPTTPILAGMAAPVSASAYNLTLRPRLDLLRNKPLLSVVCHNIASPKAVTFQTAEREGNLSMFNGSAFVDDREAIPVTDLGPRPFLPVRFRFTATVPDNLYLLLTTTPYGYFSFTYKGNTYKGFVDEISQRTADDAAVECSLLAHPATDLTTLIR